MANTSAYFGTSSPSGVVIGRSLIPEVTLPLRVARERQGLSQRALAARIGVDQKTVWLWELGKHEPPAAFVPRIEAVIGPAQVDPDAPIGERLRGYRRGLGLTQRELASQIGAQQTSVSDWERGDCLPPPRVRQLLGLRERSP